MFLVVLGAWNEAWRVWGELEMVFGGCLEVGWMWLGAWRLSFRGLWLDLGGPGVPKLRQ